MKKIISIILLISMLCGFGVNVSAYSGAGTESNPYVITTPEDLMNMKTDLSAHYVLGNSIDMSGVWYEPIGNDIDGAFTGSFDGKGYTISNLDLDLEGSKYVGLFGYLDGTVKNVNLTNVVASGYKYVGGIAGYADENSSIISCNTFGIIRGMYITGYHYIGGIVGYAHNGCIEYCTNSGSLTSNSSSYSYVGGIVGYKNLGMITDCVNRGDVTVNLAESQSFSGGIVGYNNSGVIEKCANSGKVSSTTDAWGYLHSGGIAGYNDLGTIKSCINVGSVSLALSRYSYAGGIVGVNSGAITHCTNSGFILSSTKVYYPYGGGIVGYNNSGSITNCSNSGSVKTSSLSETAYSYTGGIVGDLNPGTITNCANSGKVMTSLSLNGDSIGGITGRANGLAYIIGCYTLKFNLYERDYGNRLTIDDFKKINSFIDFDFNKEWIITPNTNSGFPQLQNMPRHIVLNESVTIIEKSDTKKLNAYIDNNSESVTWSSDDETIATVSSFGTVTGIGFGSCTITATNSEGMKANCLVIVYDKAENIEFAQDEYNISINGTVTPTVTQSPNETAEEMYWESDDTSVATVDKWTGKITGKKSGNANITATTILGGVSASCKVKVTGSPVTKLSLSKTSASINKDDNLQLTVSVTPTAYDGQITWSSSDENVATVDNTGLITAKHPGMAYIYAQAESGVTTQCTVTVKAPATEIKLNKSELTLQKGYTEKLLPAMMPEYTTDSISWASSNSSYVSVTADGTVTAKAVGQVIITATTTSGEKAYCTVNVVNPSVPVSSVTIDKTELIMTKADMAQLKASILPTNATNQSLTWVSSDESVATVNSTGVVTAVDTGVAIISATANNGIYHECVIKVISASGSSVVLSDAKASPDGTVRVKASLVKNPGISGYKFTVNYDESILTPVAVIPNGEFDGSLATNLDDDNRVGLNIVWYANEDVDVNGELFTIDFKVSDTAEYGDTSSVSIEYGAKDICNTAGEYFALYIDDATISIEEPIPGDIYEDNDVNVYDLTLLARYITSLETFTERQEEAADVNNDGRVDILDVIRLAQYLVNWSGIELMSLDLYDEPTTPVISVGSASVNAANEAEIPVYIKNNSGVLGYRFVLDYNAEDIEILSITPSELINKDGFNHNLGAESQATDGLVVSCYASGNNITDDGVLFTIKVRYKNPADTSVSPISVVDSFDNLGNENATYVIATYETGYALGSDYIVANKVVGDTNFSCELYFDDSYAEQSAKAIIAFYDGDGRMVQLMPKDITIKPGKVDLSIDYDKKAYATYKLMIWEGVNSLKPITDVK